MEVLAASSVLTKAVFEEFVALLALVVKVDMLLVDQFVSSMSITAFVSVFASARELEVPAEFGLVLDFAVALEGLGARFETAGFVEARSQVSDRDSRPSIVEVGVVLLVGRGLDAFSGRLLVAGGGFERGSESQSAGVHWLATELQFGPGIPSSRRIAPG